MIKFFYAEKAQIQANFVIAGKHTVIKMFAKSN